MNTISNVIPEIISDKQIRITITGEELAGRNITVNDLADNNERMQQLYSDLIAPLLVEKSFLTNNCPLMLEAAALSSGGLMVIVTDVEGNADILGLAPPVSRMQRITDVTMKIMLAKN